MSSSSSCMSASKARVRVPWDGLLGRHGPSGYNKKVLHLRTAEMGRQVVHGNKAKGKRDTPAEPLKDIGYDDVDKFYEQRSKIMIGSDEDESQDGSEAYEETAVMDLNLETGSDSESFEGEEGDSEASQKEALSEEEDSEERIVDVSSWGKKKKSYYSGDANAEKEEAKEAYRLQKNKLSKLSEQDYVDDGEESGQVVSQANRKDSTKALKSLLHGTDKAAPGDKLSESVARFTLEEKKALVDTHGPFLAQLMDDYKQRIVEVKDHLAPLMAKIKYQLLLSYCANICFFALLKTNGEKVDGHPVIEELVKQRTLLEKIKPIENKLRHQIERLLQASNETADGDVLSYKPNLKNLAAPKPSAVEDVDEYREAEGDLYRPPRVAPVYFDDQSAVGKARRKEELVKQSTSRSRILRELREEYSERPEELTGASIYTPVDESFSERRAAFEEENFTRLVVSKKQMKKESAKKAKMMNELDDLNDFAIADEKDSDSDSKFKRAVSKRKAAQDSDSDEEIISSDDFEGEEDHEDGDMGDERRVKGSGKGHRKENGTEDPGVGSDNEYYESVKKHKKQVQETRKKSATPAHRDTFHNKKDPEARRRVNYQIMKNKGLTPHRKKEQGNPRVRQRQRYEKAKQRIRGFKPQAKPSTSGSPYRGEKSGIKKGLARSVQLS